MRRIFVAGKDWQARALLRAQLLEEGFEVAAFETISEALAASGPGMGVPDLLVADVSASDHPSADVEALSAVARRISIWVVASRAYRVDKGLRGRGFEMILMRPVDVGELIEQVKRRLPNRE